VSGRVRGLAVIAALAAGAAPMCAQEVLVFTVPAAPWFLTLPKNAITVEQQKVDTGGRSGYFTMADGVNDITISFFIEPAGMCHDSAACRDSVRARGNPAWENPEHKSNGRIGDVSYFEFYMASYGGIPVKQENLYAEFVQDGFWVDLHVAKVRYEKSDHALFEEIVRSVRFHAKEK
jgi:hypothetical protein